MADHDDEIEDDDDLLVDNDAEMTHLEKTIVLVSYFDVSV
jgi:hypothetical protein